MIRLALENLVKMFDGVAVVDRAGLEVRPGSLAVVVGPSGAGKTVLLRLVAGLDRPDDGEIYLDGRLVPPGPPGNRSVGLVFQRDALWPHQSVAEAVEYPLRFGELSRRDRKARVQDALSRGRLESVSHQRPGDLAPLQRQRVALARALVAQPSILLLDDPLGPLADRDRIEFRDELRRLPTEADVTALLTTADPREALALADHLAVMDLGKILQSGDPAAVYNRPVDPFVARFLGPSNLIPGQVDSVDSRGDVVVRTPLGRLVGRSDTPNLPTGTPVTLSIRPEALGFSAAVPHLANRFNTTVERLIFLGETRQIHLRGGNDWPIVALALGPASLALREGQSLTVHVVADQVVVLPTRSSVPTAEVLPG